MEEYDVEFNFDLIEDTIINMLDFYNVAKDEFIAGNETEKGLKAVTEKLSRLIDCCDAFISIRLMFIENRLNDENTTEINKERLQNEIKYNFSFSLKITPVFSLINF